MHGSADNGSKGKAHHPPGFLIDTGPRVRKCLECDETKSIEEFYPRRGHMKNGRYNQPGVRKICKSCSLKGTKQWAKDNPERRRELDRKNQRTKGIKYTYGLTAERYNKMLADQENACAICKRTVAEISKEGKGKATHLHVDHDHKTGLVRGLLCQNCNIMLAHGRDNPDYLRSGAAYLERVKQV